MNVIVIYGTESGNGEMIAEDMQEQLESDGHFCEIIDLEDFSPEEFSADNFYVLICSTHGEGELPYTAQPFYSQLMMFEDSLDHVRFGVFGLGDTFYDESYMRGSETLDRRLRELGATRVGEFGKHDASSWDDPNEVALAWLPTVLDAASA